jgi:hypothetical protein
MGETDLGDMDIDRRMNVEKKAMNLVVPNKAENVLRSRVTVSFSRTLMHGVSYERGTTFWYMFDILKLDSWDFVTVQAVFCYYYVRTCIWVSSVTLHKIMIPERGNPMTFYCA